MVNTTKHQLKQMDKSTKTLLVVLIVAIILVIVQFVVTGSQKAMPISDEQTDSNANDIHFIDDYTFFI